MSFSCRHPPHSALAVIAAPERAAPSWFIPLLFNVQRRGFLLPVIQTVLWAQNYSFPSVFSMVLMTAMSECFTGSISFPSNSERILTLDYQQGKKVGGDELKEGSSSFWIPHVSHLQCEHFTWCAFWAQLPLRSATAVIKQQTGSEDLPPKHPAKAEHAADSALLPSDFHLGLFLLVCARFCKLSIPVTLFSLGFEFIFLSKLKKS